MISSKLITKINTLIKETLPLLFPVFIVYAIYDILRYLQIGPPELNEHFLQSIINFQDYSILQSGFQPLLSLVGLSSDWTLTRMISGFLFSLYILSSVAAIGYTLLFNFLCLESSYEKKWKDVHTLAVSALS